ncbi:sensor histidine kinase [Anaeromyxobacter paludicola]|uniref:histidine kinase n=1 Tax=Anaeromyxobacter paludicola TaxID=2918171 RepID=A0ABM7XAH2_9BACT|nr:hybrid sensor histidine kinase/response regulator [Anaeromyxobacter paludicola]BDG08815.1 hybrid sensor histidine kinase/response regulator [Anaeromyxobacter paludicola]
MDERSVAVLVERFGVGTSRSRGVLVVDDEPFNVQVLRVLLEDRWVVHAAASGEEALRISERVPLDVVVTDQRMPGMTGVELLERLRERGHDAAGVVITGFADMQALERAINRARAFRFLRKPWEPADVLQAVEQAADQVAQRRTISKLVELLARRSDELQASLDRLGEQQRMLLDLERLGTIGQLTAGVTHDLKNVIVGLRAAEWEMSQTTVSPELRETLTACLAGVDDLSRTLSSLHGYARGGLGVQLAPLDPGQVVSDALAIARMDRLYRLRDVVSEVAPGLPPVRADRQKLTQVLVNLVRNALQATQGRAQVRVLAQRRDGGVELAVEDQGPGVAPELRERLFQPFASSKGQEGLGLGLYMARLIVESHQGRIGVSERPGGGARFEVSLPVVTEA